MGGNRTAVTSLTVQAKLWPTPRASDGTRGSDPAHGDGGPSLKLAAGHGLQVATTLPDGSAGSRKVDLSPFFVAALMGLPWDWLTHCTWEATDSCHSAPPAPGPSYSNDQKKEEKMMTSSIPIPDEVRRDQWGRYLVVPPAGGKPVGYTRATTVAKTLDAEGGLAAWMTTMAITGLMVRKGLRAQWEALIAETNGDPWYNSPASKAQAKALVEECKEAGGSSDRAKVGTALHAITAAVDAGKDISHLSDETATDVAAYVAGLSQAGVVIDQRYIERTCVLDDWQVAGTFDRIAVVGGVPMIADLKTGDNLEYSWLQIAVQMAIYNHADAIYQQGPAANGHGDERLPMPEVDRNRALIMHLPAGQGRLDLYLVDTARGWEAFQHSMWTRGWRASSSSIAAPLVPEDSLATQLQASLDAVGPRKGEPAPVPPSQASDPEVLRSVLQQRVDAIGAHPAARQDLMAYWPPDMPSVRQAQPAQFQAISAVLDGVEKRCSIPFPDNLALVLELFPGTTIINEEQPS